MRSSLLSAACVAALFALPALAQETTTTTDDTTAPDATATDTGTADAGATDTGATDAGATDAGATGDAATGTEPAAGEGTAAQATDAGTDTTTDTGTDTGTETGTETGTDTEATAGTATETTEGAATDATATDATATDATETDATETETATEPATETTTETATEEPATEGEAVVTDSAEAAATEDAPLPSDPQQALALAAAQLDEAADEFSANYGAGTDPAATGATGTEGTTTTTTTVEVDPESRQRVTDALDNFDEALTQYGAEGGDEQVQDQIATLQSQTAQIREQLDSDPVTALDGIEQLTQAAMSLPQAEIPAEADSIMGRQLVSSDGEEVGEINDVLVTAEGQVEAVIIKRGGALGLGGTDVAVPWDQLQIQGDQMMVNMTRDQMEQMPEYVTD